MCGGITAALGMATAKDAQGRTRPALLLTYQLGRISSYALAGLLLAGMFGGLVSLLDIESVRRTLRALSALALLVGALVAFGRVRDPGIGIGRKLWPKLAPLGRRLLPVKTLPRAFAFGMVWGWMPCGFVYSVLLIATLQLDAVRGALTMAAFGLGTAPALLHRRLRRRAIEGVRIASGRAARRRIRAAAQRGADVRRAVGGTLHARTARLAAVRLRSALGSIQWTPPYCQSASR